MSRLSRNLLKTNYFHIMCQGINRIYIFSNDKYKLFYLKTMKNLLNLYPVKIIAYCIMDNHVHLLIYSNKVEYISKYMQKLNSKFALYYNKNENRVGYVFRDRFKSQGIYNEKQLYNCINYIYLNPVKAGVCNNPYKYEYANCKEIMNIENCKYIFIDTEKEENNQIHDLVENILRKNNIGLCHLKNNKELLKRIVYIMKAQKISNTKIAKELKINRMTVSKIIQDKK